MLKSHEKFHPTGGRRQVLVADDEPINREILGHWLATDYEVLFASDGREALEAIRAHRETLSLVLLDLLMPGMSGMEVLEAVKSDPELERIPVIVATSDQSAEIESLDIGAIDFISKPYPQAGVVLARVRRTIELSEDQQIIQSTERDPLTGLYNREYFYSYADKLDQHHRDREMDAVMVDVNHFHIINERYGKGFGDQVLRRVGQKLREAVEEEGGMVCRRGADTFMVYCPHRDDYRDLLERASVGLDGGSRASNRVRLRMGVYSNVDKAIDIERRFDRAKSASDAVRGSFVKAIGFYDDRLHRAELFHEQLIEDFHTAIRENQFKVFYQPKFDIRPEIPVLASAEALVRWFHPELGVISPGVFIPLFEDNGLIQELDCFVWDRAAAQVRRWRDRFGMSVPVSVNVSRVDMCDPNLADNLHRLLSEYGLTPREFLLEITESAYTEDSEQIIAAVKRMRSLGFQIEMDDFGTGYSSLSMISNLPIDALKLDMEFIRNAFREGGDTRLIEVIIDIAEYLGVPVIAEGVETEDQLRALKRMGCDLVQGYYFSKPVPPSEYERFIEARSRLSEAETAPAGAPALGASAEPSYDSIVSALTSGFESIYYVDAGTGFYVRFSDSGRHEDLQIERSGADFFTEVGQHVRRYVSPEDRDRVALSLEKDALLQQVASGAAFSMTYRVSAGGKPACHNLRVVSVGAGAGRQLVIGISAVDAPVLQPAPAESLQAHGRAFLSIARALSSDFESICYVDTETGDYSRFAARRAGEDLDLEVSGTDFFGEYRRSLLSVVWPEDRAGVSDALDRQRLLKRLERGPVYSHVCRMMVDGGPAYYQIKAVRVEDDGRHIVVGVSNIDRRVKHQEEFETAKAENVTFASIAQALAEDYFSIYYVDTADDRYIEFSAHGSQRGLKLEGSGENFFESARAGICRAAHPADQQKICVSFTRENLMRELEASGSFTLTYRMVVDGAPTYVNMKATRMADGGHIVIGISSVDAQMRREQELNEAREKANRDALTGVKSKHAYVEAETALDASIASGEASPFAIAVCDVNGLKRVNDTQGHQVGDQMIRAASAIICDIFKHSPVFRIGGDEFVAILRGQDYEARGALMARLEAENAQNRARGGVIVAGGLSDYDAGADHRASEVFQRADAIMYENKKRLKAQR